MAKYTDGITPQGREALIADQLKRGLLTEDEADTATETGEVKIGSRVIDYGEDTQTDQSDEPATPPEEDSRPLVNDLTDLQPKTVEARDRNGNSVMMPGKFKFAGGKTDTVEQGIIIEDGDGNQFVWIPVSNIDGGDNPEDNKPIIKDDRTEVTITLGRYEDFTMKGETMPTPKQKGSEFAKEVILKAQGLLGDTRDYTELNESREASEEGNSLEDLNATAKNLREFISSVQKNHGYYIGRYEASYGSGSTFGVGNDASYYKPLVQKSTKNTGNASDWKEEKGFLWNRITQGNASKVCRNMYNESDEEYNYVESDLVNSYMWDTAIVYIQAMENSNYANAKSSSTTLKNTGETGDEKCNIFDMVENLMEWTTEYSTCTLGSVAYPFVSRGGSYNISGFYTAERNSFQVRLQQLRRLPPGPLYKR